VRQFKKIMAWGPKGAKQYYKDPLGIKHESYSVTLLISLREDNTIYSRIEIRKDTNKAIDFALFMVRACRDKFIRERDVVVMDNAKIHHTPETLLQIKKCMDILSAKIQYLPTYSPETNPCELVFSLVKEDLKGKVLEDGTFATLIESAFAKVTKDNIYSFYRHCIHNSTRIEDQVFFN